MKEQGFKIDIIFDNVKGFDSLPEKMWKELRGNLTEIFESYCKIGLMPRQGERIIEGGAKALIEEALMIQEICYCDWGIMIFLTNDYKIQ